MASEVDKSERALLDAYERGKLRSELAKFKEASRATAIKTLIASVLHEFVTGRLTEY